MPVFDYKCKNCQNRLNDEFVWKYDAVVTCPRCGERMQRLITNRFVADCFPAEGIHLKHVCAGGKTFYSKREMKRYAKEHDLELGALL